MNAPVFWALIDDDILTLNGRSVGQMCLPIEIKDEIIRKLNSHADLVRELESSQQWLAKLIVELDLSP